LTEKKETRHPTSFPCLVSTLHLVKYEGLDTFDKEDVKERKKNGRERRWRHTIIPRYYLEHSRQEGN